MHDKTTAVLPLRTALLFATATGLVGGMLLTIATTATSRIKAAVNWDEVPCKIESLEWNDDDDGNKWLALEFSYVYGRAEYQSDRLDLLSGSMGDDVGWEQSLAESHPVGATSICFVNPDDPSFAVLDRTHGSSGVGNLRLLAFPFVCISGGFLLAALRNLAAPTGHRNKSIDGAVLGPPPRRLGLWTKLNVILGGSTPVAWMFLVGFSLFFVVLDGPGHVAALMRAGAGTKHAPGRVTAANYASQREFGQQVYEYDFEFQVDGVTHPGSSFSRRKYEVDDRVRVEYQPEHLAEASIRGERSISTPLWVAMIPAAVVSMLIFGLLSTYRMQWRSLRLLCKGRRLPATRLKDESIKLPYSAHKWQPPPFVFEWDGQVHVAKGLQGRIADDCAAVNVVFAEGRPSRNVIVESLSIGSQSLKQPLSFWRVLPNLAVPVLGTAALFVLYLLQLHRL